LLAGKLPHAMGRSPGAAAWPPALRHGLQAPASSGLTEQTSKRYANGAGDEDEEEEDPWNPRNSQANEPACGPLMEQAPSVCREPENGLLDRHVTRQASPQEGVLPLLDEESARQREGLRMVESITDLLVDEALQSVVSGDERTAFLFEVLSHFPRSLNFAKCFAF
jgi:hypothetical protein